MKSCTPWIIFFYSYSFICVKGVTEVIAPVVLDSLFNWILLTEKRLSVFARQAGPDLALEHSRRVPQIQTTYANGD